MPAPKDHPKWGGRKKGFPNGVHVATRERIKREADPVGFLMRVVQGEDIGGEIPMLDQRMSAAKTLAGKVVPDLRATELEVDDLHQKSVKELTDEELMAIVRAEN